MGGKVDYVIERSRAQKHLRVEKLRQELAAMGYSVVPTEWLNEQFWQKKLEAAKVKPKVMETP